MDKNIYVVGYPRSGHTWLQRLLSDCLGWPVQNWPEDTPEWWGPEKKLGMPCIVKRHVPVSEKPDGRVVVAVRDPRDVAVSLMHYRKYPDLISTIRDMLTVNDPARDLYGPYGEMVEGWRKDDGCLFCHYESLHRLGPAFLYVLLDNLGEKASQGRCNDAFDRQSIAAFRQAHPGRDLHAVRNGRVGEWKEWFHQGEAALIHQYLGVLMFKQGYIADDAWWTKVS